MNPAFAYNCLVWFFVVRNLKHFSLLRERLVNLVSVFLEIWLKFLVYLGQILI